MFVETSWAKKRWSNRSVSFYMIRHADISKNLNSFPGKSIWYVPADCTRFGQKQPLAKSLICSCWLYTLRLETTPGKNYDVFLLIVYTLRPARNNPWQKFGCVPADCTANACAMDISWPCVAPGIPSEHWCHGEIPGVDYVVVSNAIYHMNVIASCVPSYEILSSITCQTIFRASYSYIQPCITYMACSIIFLGTISQQKPMIHTIVLHPHLFSSYVRPGQHTFLNSLRNTGSRRISWKHIWIPWTVSVTTIAKMI